MHVEVTTKEETLEKVDNFCIYGAIGFNYYNTLLCRIWTDPLNGYYPIPEGAVMSGLLDRENLSFKGLYMNVRFDYTQRGIVEKRLFFSDVLRRINR